MKIPKNLTKRQTLAIIEKVSAKLAPKFTFGYYDLDDIKQECFIIACDGLERYDGRAPLENFLTVHIRNRLILFVRDNYYRRVDNCKRCEELGETCPSCIRRESTNSSKQNLMNPLGIQDVQLDKSCEKNMYVYPNTDCEIQEIMDIIRDRLPIDLTEDYLKLLDGLYVPRPKRDLIKSCIINILKDLDICPDENLIKD